MASLHHVVQVFPMLKRLGHKDIRISHYCFDRALFSTLERKQLQRHALYHEISVVGGEKVGARFGRFAGLGRVHGLRQPRRATRLDVVFDERELRR